MTEVDRRFVEAGPSMELVATETLPDAAPLNLPIAASDAGAADNQMYTGASAQELSALAKRFGTPLLVFDPDVLARSYTQLCEALPGVGLHFAVKAFPNPGAIRGIGELGFVF